MRYRLLILAGLLFISVFTFFMLVFVPRSEYDPAPAAVAIDFSRSQLEKMLIEGRKDMLETLQKTAGELMRYGIFAGAGLGVLGFLLFVKFIGAFAVLTGALFFLGGILLTRIVFENEFKRWQDSLFEGIPQLVSFVPAFLEIKSITTREALNYTVKFLPEPLKTEMFKVIDKIIRTDRAKEALEEFAYRAKNPVVDAICFRLSANWDADVQADIFADLEDQVADMNEVLITKATVAKTGYFALICVLGLIGMLLSFGYPGAAYMMEQLTKGFGM